MWGVLTTEQGLQGRGLNHPRWVFPGTATGVGVGFVDDGDFVHQELPIDDLIEVVQVLGEFAHFSPA